MGGSQSSQKQPTQARGEYANSIQKSRNNDNHVLTALSPRQSHFYCALKLPVINVLLLTRRYQNMCLVILKQEIQFTAFTLLPKLLQHSFKSFVQFKILQSFYIYLISSGCVPWGWSHEGFFPPVRSEWPYCITTGHSPAWGQMAHWWTLLPGCMTIGEEMSGYICKLMTKYYDILWLPLLLSQTNSPCFPHSWHHCPQRNVFLCEPKRLPSFVVP